MSNFYTEPFVSAGEMEFPSEPYITAQPQNHTATGPEEYVLKVIAAGAVSYQWEVFDGESWSAISGATSDTLTISIDSSMNGWRYRVLVTGADGSTVVSKAAQIAVKGVQEITLEGAIVTFTGPARIKSLEVGINAVQSGTGDPSPDNIRPISGWDAVNVVVSPTLVAEDGTTYPISLGQTVYGGTLDVTSGVLTVTHLTVDMGDLVWLLAPGATHIWSTGINDKKNITSPPYSNRQTSIICSAYGADSQISISENAMNNCKWLCIEKKVFIKDTAYSSASDFKTAVTGQKIVYELATPTTVTLTPTQVETLLGTNNIWADSGDIIVTIIR